MRNYSLLILLFCATILCASCVSVPQAQKPVRLLFVGNSLTYVGNLPAVLDALASTNQQFAQSDMIAKGGYTLSQHLADDSVERALAGKRYDFVILQDRGGDIICSFGPASCQGAETSLGELARLAEGHGAKAILLGTYQPLATISVALVKAEATAAKRLSIAHVPVSGYFQAGIAAEPQAEWLNKDGAHPGPDLTLLKAVLLYRQLFGTLPGSGGFSVHAPMQGPSSQRTSTQTYTAGRVASVLGVAAGRSP